MQPDDVGFVDLHLRLNDREIGDRQQQADVAGERARHGDFALFDGKPGHPARHRREQMRLRELIARFPQARARLLDEVLRRRQVGLGDVGSRLGLLELLLRDEVWVLLAQLLVRCSARCD